MIRPTALCIGSATLDTFLTTEVPLSKIKLGDKVLVRSLEKHSGGGATNAGAALSKLGMTVKILTKLGKDHDADFILKELKEYRIRNICKHHSRKNTDVATIISSMKEKDRIIYVHKGASLQLSTADFRGSQLKARWIYLATLLGKSFTTAKVIAEFAKKKKIPLLFNPSLYLAQRGKKALRPILQGTKILVLNKREAQALLTTIASSMKKLLLGLHALGPETVVITNGPKKLYALHEGKYFSLLPPRVKVVHTAGAGDAFTAAFLAGIIKKYPFANALRLGQANANSVIQHVGTKNKLLTEREAEKLIKKYKIQVHEYEI